MKKMINKCNNCIHSNVCIYKQRYQENYNALEKELKQNEPFSIELDCKEYKFNNPISSYKDLKINYASINPCEGCSIYEDIKKGKTIVNDACTFCSKNPNPIRIGD